jgi:hypothetical protein
MKKYVTILFAVIIPLAFFSCKKDDAERVVRKWAGKEIQFPTKYQCNFIGMDTTLVCCNQLFNTEYKVLLYVDSIGCTSCRLKLSIWKKIVEESDSLFKDKLSFLFFFQPNNEKEMNFLLKKDKFKYPIFIDSKNNINRLNHFPNQSEYQCFLLDKDNRVLMIGNPTLNPKIWELYKQTITGDTNTSSQNQPITTVSVEQTEIELTGLVIGKTSHAVFKLKNTGNNPLLIHSVNTSCGCTVPTWEKKPIEAGEETEIKVAIKPEESGVFHKTIQVFGNVEKEDITLTVKGLVEK